jgi:hypothetical protein
MKTLETSAAKPNVTGERSTVWSVIDMGVGFEDTMNNTLETKLEETGIVPLNRTVSPTSNSEPDPDNVITPLVMSSTRTIENSTVAATAACEPPNPLPVTSIKASVRELLTEATKKSPTTVSCDITLLEEEYEFNAESVIVTTLPAFCGCNANAGILKIVSFVR